MLDFTFNNKVASEHGIRLQGSIEFSEAIPVMETISVPGRNGDLHVYSGNFENRTATASCFVLADNAADAMAAVNAFLFENFTGGYKALTTSDDPNHYWEAQVVKASAMKTRAGKLNPFEIVFTCKPYRVDIESGDVVL